MTAQAQHTLSAFELSLLEPELEPVGKNVLKRGVLCPECTAGLLDYNGLLELECPKCGFKSGGGGGCT